MPNPAAISVAGLAAKKAIEFMVSTYKRKYGKFGEKAVKARDRKLAEAKQVIKNLIAENKELQKQVDDGEDLLGMETEMTKLMTKERDEFRTLANTRLNIINARDGGVRPLDDPPK